MRIEKISNLKRYSFNVFKSLMGQYGFTQQRSHFKFLFTSSSGLFLFDRGRIHKLLSGNFFGITQLPDERYLAVTYVQDGTKDERSLALTFKLAGNKAEAQKSFNFISAEGEVKVPVRVHQIICFNGKLWVTNTRQNIVWRCDLNGRIEKSFIYSQSFNYAPGCTSTDVVRKTARNSQDYHHFNSIHIDENFLYLLAHNSAGSDKSKNSFYLKLDHEFNVLERTDNVGKACHNLVPCEQGFYICDSANGQLVHPKLPNIQLGYFLRGLTLIDNHLIAGGTVSSSDPNLRGKGDSRLFFIPVGNAFPIMSLSLGRTGDLHDIVALK
ncbi:hypothetical protein FE810_01045 [Thalassotalea litorea]|uniref:DUF4915 domain-containing protein n=1 Tax=Thalassotalea litorea TaxID=2020715 RepID=A0A5R9IPU5_9GAMM|nr:hypothetical protein [Thalassotalea litorea]TLU67564.1 hypothetical protein FE810_01045 [Thalassotalea litorea]